MTTNSDKINEFKTIIENLGEKNELSLKNSNIEDDDAKSLAEALKHTQITKLDLSDNRIGCNGLKYLADALNDTQINKLNLRNNNLLSEGVKYLVEVLKDTKIRELDLAENIISFETAEYLNKLLRSTTVQYLYLDIYCLENSVKCIIEQRSYRRINNFCIELEKCDIGVAGSKYINACFNETGIIEVKFNFCFYNCNRNEIHNLAEAFKNINISQLRLPYCFTNPQDVKYLVEIFEKSQIGQLNLAYLKLNLSHISHLAEFLKQIKILGLDLSLNRIGDESMKVLAPALKNNNVMDLHLSWSSLTSEGAKYLSGILQDSKILYIDLCHNSIGIEGAKYLANGLRFSQVTHIHLHGNDIEYEGYQALINVADDTNISWVNLHCNNIEAGMNGEKLWPYSIPRKNYSIMACEIKNAFKGIVKFNSKNNEYEFTLPIEGNQCYPPMDIDQYAFLIRTLKNTPNSKVHIYKEINGDGTEYDGYNFIGMKRIDDFIANITNKFISFIEDNLPDLIDKFENADYINLVKQFEELKLHDIVQNLLLHRVLYYIDENQEILHPYIYKLLHQYSLPLYNSQLEPNKKAKIISYYESHQDIDGVKEIIDLLKSSSL